MSKKIAVSVILIMCTVHLFLPALEARTYKKDHVFYVEGSVEAADWYERGLLAITDYANFRRWITKGLDGKDPVSAEFWEHFVDFVYEAPNTMTVVYDLNLGWPLGSKGNKARFSIDESELFNGTLRLNVMDNPTGIEDVSLSIYTEPSKTVAGGKSFRFEMALRFSWLLEALIDIDKMGAHMNIVIGRAVSNLEAYCQVRPH